MPAPLKQSSYTFLGLTQSLCPECLEVVPAKIVSRNRRVYFRKQCPTHGPREDFVCSDVSMYDQLDYSLPSKLPRERGIEPDRGCPWDCGLCTEHEQHTCIGIVELTSSCNLTCPMCYANSAPGGVHVSLEDCRRAIDRLVEVEARPEVLQLSGGEPTVHPQFEQVLEYALSQPIDYVMINTNGLRLGKDPALVELIARNRRRIEVYFQFDGFDERTSLTLRGESLVAAKLAAIETLGRAGVHTVLVTTIQGGVNEHELGAIVRFAAARPWITAVSLQPATYSGRHVMPEELEKRITFPDVIRLIERQTEGMFRAGDFMPLPCAHPNCHQISYAYRSGETVLPVARFIDARKNMDLLANGISLTRSTARDLMLQYLGRQGCCGGECGPNETAGAAAGEATGLNVLSGASLSQLALPGESNGGGQLQSLAAKFFSGALAEELGAEQFFRITITNFLDPYNFDVRRVMKCCTHHVLPSGHVIPFCAYNTLYRNGKAPLPPLRETAAGTHG